MSGFRKAKAEQAALKIGLYGPPGSGKTFTSLLIAEGLAKISNKRVAYVDTERGTDFYCKSVPTRSIHPDAFDFDALYSRSITEVLGAIRSLSPHEYGVVVLDSVTHLWESAIAAYNGPKTRAGTLPMQAWGRIKKPYKDLMAALLSAPLHVLICGRQGVEYAEDEETSELKAVGYKMKAEGETPYEPHILIRMEAVKPKRTNETATIVAYAEKDRTGILAGRSFSNPTFQTLCAPLLGLLGETQAYIASSDETAAIDAETLAQQEQERAQTSQERLEQFTAQITLAGDEKSLKAIGKRITPQEKSAMLPQHVALLRERYHAKESQIAGKSPVTPEPQEA